MQSMIMTLRTALLALVAHQAIAARRLHAGARVRDGSRHHHRLAAVPEAERPIFTPMKGTWTTNKFEYRNLLDAKPAPLLLMDLFARATLAHGTEAALVTPTETSTVVDENTTEYAFDMKPTTWNEYYIETMQVASALLNLGMQPMDAVAIKGLNSKEWFVSFMGTVAAGGMPVGMYPTDSPELLEFKARDSNARFAVAGKQRDFDAFVKISKDAEIHMTHIIGFGDSDPTKSDKEGPAKLMTWGQFVNAGDKPKIDFNMRCCCPATNTPGWELGCELLSQSQLNPAGGIVNHLDKMSIKLPFGLKRGITKRLGQKPTCNGAREATSQNLHHNPTGCAGLAAPKFQSMLSDNLQKALASQRPGQVGSVVYTSGTTGNAKGVMLSQDSLTWGASRVSGEIMLSPKHAGFKGPDRTVSYLPLNHIAGQMMDIVGPVYIAAVAHNFIVHFPSPCMVSFKCVPEYFQKVKPTIYLGVPEVWDKIRLKLQKLISPAMKGKMLKIAANLPLVGIKEKLGLQKLRIAVSGAGELKPSTVDFFHNISIDIYNIYGQSESSGVGTMMSPTFFKLEKNNTIGKLCPQTESRYKKILGEDNATELGDELQLRGRHIMLGYLNLPKKSEEAIDDEGWLATGDLAETDKEGYVQLTGRAKDIMKVGGEMVAPVPAEMNILQACTAPGGGALFSSVVVVGDHEHYLSALVMLQEGVEGDTPTGRLVYPANSVDPAAKTIEDAKKSEVWTATISKCITHYNANMALNRVAAIWRWKILDHMPSSEDVLPGTDSKILTETKKLKRNLVVQHWNKEYVKCYPCSNRKDAKNVQKCEPKDAFDGMEKNVMPC